MADEEDPGAEEDSEDEECRREAAELEALAGLRDESTSEDSSGPVVIGEPVLTADALEVT